ncbi:hypothetical protein [Trinickia mobilis]|uniref:hypothetical protein n=1 Tax=Trinickia mobilis TaxID=2816356 RepID=UPI001A90238A|nr:hypothetical protein [Trinickia mobilis]
MLLRHLTAMCSRSPRHADVRRSSLTPALWRYLPPVIPREDLNLDHAAVAGVLDQASDTLQVDHTIAHFVANNIAATLIDISFCILIFM